MSLAFPTIYPVACHTDNIGPGSTFVAIKGQKLNGIDYIPRALEKGATHIVYQDDCLISDETKALMQKKSVLVSTVPNARRALAQLSAHALNYPARKLKIIGVTGTIGKTTSVFLLDHLLKKNGYKTALLSSAHNHINNFFLSCNLTTALPDYLHVFLDVCINEKIDYVIMEVAAQAITLDRTYGIEFEGILFTNFSEEHGEFYPSIDDYFNAKLALLNQVKSKSRFLVNKDVGKLKLIAEDFQLPTFSLKDTALITGTIKTNNAHGISGNLHFKDKYIPFSSNLIGSFNTYNLIGTIGLLILMNIPLSMESFLDIKPYVPGRMESYHLPNGCKAIIDYAYNPTSFLSLFSTLSTLTKKLIVVFGAGGDRDPSKRPLMGSLAEQYANSIILTTDNPRSEEAADIVNHILSGISNEGRNKVIIELDREKAIKMAYELSDPSTIIALLGKGPDEYQLINGVKYPFSEKNILKSLQ